MINLLPPDLKEDFIYGRRNTKLRRWSISLFVCILGIFSVVAIGQLYMQRSIKSYAKQVDQGNNELREQKLTETQNRVKEISNSMNLVVQVLSREILFSKLLTQVGAILPNGIVLTDLSISDVEGGIDLRADAVNFQAATQLQVNLEDPANKIFEKADTLNTQCSAQGPTATNAYPCSVHVRALFAKENPFSFISKKETKQP